MKKSLLILFFLLLFAIPANAKIYKWIDDDGVFHAVDDLHKVPEKDRDKLGLDLEALKEEIQAPEKSIIKPMPQEPPSPTRAVKDRRPIDPSDVLYGGKTLEWWVKTFSRVRREKSELEQAINAKEEYNRVYVSGVRLLQKQKKIYEDKDVDELLEERNIYEKDKKYETYYTQESVDRYKRYIEELPGDKERLAKKKEYLEKLLRKAKNAGVPRDVRGE